MDGNTVEIVDEGKLTPQEYFEAVKERKHTIDDGQLQKVYDNCLELLNKYRITGQTKGIEKLMFHLSCIEKSEKLLGLE